MELPPLHDDRWDELLRAVLADAELVGARHPGGQDGETPPDTPKPQRETEEPSGRRSSASS